MAFGLRGMCSFAASVLVGRVLIVREVGWSFVVLEVEVKWMCVICCRNWPGHFLHMDLMMSFAVVGVG